MPIGYMFCIFCSEKCIYKKKKKKTFRRAKILICSVLYSRKTTFQELSWESQSHIFRISDVIVLLSCQPRVTVT